MPRGTRTYRSDSEESLSEETDFDESFGSDSEDGWVKQKKKPQAKVPVTKRKPAAAVAKNPRKVVVKKKKVPKKRKVVKPKRKAPKNPQTAYMIYRTAATASLKQANPTWSFQDLTKKVSEMWKDLSDDDKEPFKLAAEDDKVRYEKEMATYTPSDDEDDEDDDEDEDEHSIANDEYDDDEFEDGSEDYEGRFQNKSSSNTRRQPPKKKAKKEKKPGPKRPSNAYLIFVNAKRPEILRQNPNWPITEAVRHLGASWKNMSDIQKKPFNDLAVLDKARYVKELSEFNL